MPCAEMTVLGSQSGWITSRPFAEVGPAFVGFSRKVFREFGLRDVIAIVDWVHRQTDKAASCGLLCVAIGMLLPREASVFAKKRDVSFVANEGEETLGRRRLREPVSSSTRRGVPIRRDSKASHWNSNFYTCLVVLQILRNFLAYAARFISGHFCGNETASFVFVAEKRG